MITVKFPIYNEDCKIVNIHSLKCIKIESDKENQITEISKRLTVGNRNMPIIDSLQPLGYVVTIRWGNRKKHRIERRSIAQW